jgi:predicted nicotinamide N-methyase
MLRADHAAAPPDDLAPWVMAMTAFVHAHTRPTVPAYVPEVTLRLGLDSVGLWHRVECELGLRGFVPYWAFAWAGGLALARHLLDHRDLVAGRRVLDLAAGSGLAGIAAAMCGAAHVVANDIDPLAVIAMSLNAEANGVAVEANPSDLLAPDGPFDFASFDVVLVGDAFYDHDLAQRARTFLARCDAAGCEVLIGDPGRADLPVERLVKLSGHAVPVSRDCQYVAASPDPAPGHDLRAATVWAFAR